MSIEGELGANSYCLKASANMMHKLEASVDAHYCGIDADKGIIYALFFKLSEYVSQLTNFFRP